MQIELCVKLFDTNWSDQIVFLLLFSNKENSLLLSKCVANTHKVNLKSGIGAESFGTCALRQRRWPGRTKAGWIKDCAGICQKPVIILVQERSSISERQINITLLWLWEYIQDSSNWCCKFWCRNGSFICRETRQQLLFNYRGCVWIDENKEIQQDKWIFIWLK